MGRPYRQKNPPTQETCYHVWTQVVQQKFCIDPQDKERFLEILNILRETYFVEILNCKIMDNHVHLTLKVHVPLNVTVEELERRFKNLYPNRKFHPEKAEEYKAKWGDLSEFMKSLNERFAKYMNKKHGWKGHFWAERFKSSILRDEDAILNCLSYVDLNYTNATGVAPHDEPFYNGGIPYILSYNRNGLFNVNFIANLAQSISIPEYEAKVKKEFSNKFVFLSNYEREGYLKYLAFVYMRKAEILNQRKTWGKIGSIAQ